MSENNNFPGVRNNFAANLKKLRKSHNITQEELGKALNVKKSCISNYEQGFSMPDIQRLMQIADFFNIKNIGSLIGYSPRNIVNEDDDINRDVPIVNSIVFGEDSTRSENVIDDLKLPNINLRTGNFFGYIVPDNSMARSKIRKGDIAIIRRQSIVSTGDIVLVAIKDQEPLLRRLYMVGNTISLQPDSDDNGYLPIMIDSTADNYEILGRLSLMQVTF